MEAPISDDPNAQPRRARERMRDAARRLLQRRRRFFPLPFRARVGVFVAGIAMVLVGLAGLVLPGIQGILSLVLGAALLSLTSERLYARLHELMVRWPSIWRRLDGSRLKMLRWLRKGRRR
jgi:uncharacterized membrane protein